MLVQFPHQHPQTPDAEPQSRWPDPPAQEAFRGLAGDIISTIEPHSEADPVALLAQFLAAFGNIAGRSPYFAIEADQHRMNLFVVLVGTTAKARKGTSWGHIQRLFEMVDPAWAQERVVTGLSSGEGLIWAVRDRILKQEPVREKGRVVGYQQVEEDPGVDDKRLVVYEPEFASALRVMTREGNTLSATVRQAWDAGNLRTLTKNCPAVATGAHISIIAHVTKDELLRNMTVTEAANGFANRFIYLCVRRSKVLPEGGRISEVNFKPLMDRLRKAVEFARTAGQLQRDEEARELWREVYPALSEGKPGLLGAVIARAEAQVMRLACIYALLDCSTEIRREHLEAALALWDYAEASARFIFGEALGDPIADRILEALRLAPQGMTRSGIQNVLGRNVPAFRITAALDALLAAGLVQRKREKTAGRPTERWFATVSS